MKGKLAESLAKKNVFEKQKTLLKYIPDVSRSLMGVMQHIKNGDRISDKHRSIFDEVEKMSDAFNKAEKAGTKKKNKQDPPTQGYSDSLLIGKLTDAVTKISTEEEIGQDVDNPDSSSVAGIGKNGKKASSSSAKMAVDLFLALNTSDARHTNVFSTLDTAGAGAGQGGMAMEVSQDFSLLSQESHASTVRASVGRWLHIKGEVSGKIWVAYEECDMMPAYEMRS
jgi:hypothetical protein